MYMQAGAAAGARAYNCTARPVRRGRRDGIGAEQSRVLRPSIFDILLIGVNLGTYA
jgi:hypothetical protein